MIYNVVVVSGVQQSDSVIHVCIVFQMFSHLGRYILLRRVSCAIQ